MRLFDFWMFLMVFCIVIAAYLRGYHNAVKDTERRWSDAVKRTDEHRRVEQANADRWKP